MSKTDFQNEFRKRRLESGVQKLSKDEVKRMKLSKMQQQQSRQKQAPMVQTQFTAKQQVQFSQSNIVHTKKGGVNALPKDFFQQEQSQQRESASKIEQKEVAVQQQPQNNKNIPTVSSADNTIKNVSQYIPRNFFDPTKEDEARQAEELKSLETELSTYEKELQQEKDKEAEQIQQERLQQEQQLEEQFEQEQLNLLKPENVQQQLEALRKVNQNKGNKIPKRRKLMESFVTIEEADEQDNSSDLENDELDGVSWMGKTSVGFLKKKP
eukprot:TRINITY_DN23335_c0_g1_i2.p1 TRINITY_DN23335_c0_g1~~TRINITY_DN23335_c0_g1_i2.p1  ORF type:complete len:294 (-),score=43.07 TRINITY_DN23335_c0_g1_i2:258-1061(-)